MLQITRIRFFEWKLAWKTFEVIKILRFFFSFCLRFSSTVKWAFQLVLLGLRQQRVRKKIKTFGLKRARWWMNGFRINSCFLFISTRTGKVLLVFSWYLLCLFFLNVEFECDSWCRGKLRWMNGNRIQGWYSKFSK